MPHQFPPTTSPSNSRSLDRWWAWLGAVAVTVGLCVPLFIGLDRWDLQNDEAIYSYAVDRMVTGSGWGTPRSIPTSQPFLEKPPLKFWMVAGPIDIGLLPHNEFGMRFVDALLGSAALLYVYVLGVALAGPICGVVAALVLFLFEPLVFEHGLRSNNMEASLLLCLTAGLYHFKRWVEAATPHARGHALGVAGYFVLGFMTKFVAALFLPAIAVVALALRRDGWRRLVAGWRDWVAAALLAVSAIAPWFIYQTQETGWRVWQVMLGQHVFRRFTAYLDRQHLEPWSFYFTETWRHLHRAGTLWLVVAGLVALGVASLRRDAWLPRLVLIWVVVPFTLLSLGTSKLFHYAYPFLPPLGLAAGFAAVLWIHALRRTARFAAARLVVKPSTDASPRPGPRGGLMVAEGFGATLAVLALLLLLPASSYRRIDQRDQDGRGPAARRPRLWRRADRLWSQRRQGLLQRGQRKGLPFVFLLPAASGAVAERSGAGSGRGPTPAARFRLSDACPDHPTGLQRHLPSGCR